MKPALRLFPLRRSQRPRILLPRTFSRRRSRLLSRVHYPLQCVLLRFHPLQDRKRRPCAFPDARTVALVSEKDSAVDRDAQRGFSKSADRGSTGREKLNAGVLGASRYVRIDFDYPDLDVFFLAMENSAVITLNESNFDRELTQDDKPMIVDFWAEWCGPCKMIAPLLDEIAREKTGTLKIAKVNVDENQSLSAKYNIRAIPALLFFKNGQLRDQVVGVASKKDLLSRLEALA